MQRLRLCAGDDTVELGNPVQSIFDAPANASALDSALTLWPKLVERIDLNDKFVQLAFDRRSRELNIVSDGFDDVS